MRMRSRNSKHGDTKHGKEKKDRQGYQQLIATTTKKEKDVS